MLDLEYFTSSCDTINNRFQIQPGEDGCFRVRVKGNVKVDWYKGEELLEDVGHVVIVDEEDGETFTLALEEASAEDSGMYKCVASNKAGTVSCSASLKVLVPSGEKASSSKQPSPGDVAPSELSPTAPYFDEPQQDIIYDVNEGDTVAFNLNVHGQPEPEVEWFKDDEKLSDGGHHHITKSGGKHELRLQNMTIEDSGIYKCIASNEEGMDERTFKLDVEGKVWGRVEGEKRKKRSEGNREGGKIGKKDGARKGIEENQGWRERESERRIFSFQQISNIFSLYISRHSFRKMCSHNPPPSQRLRSDRGRTARTRVSILWHTRTQSRMAERWRTAGSE